MSKTLFNRRTALGLGAAALLAPFLDVVVERPARAAAIKRLVLFYTTHGTVYDNWALSSQPGSEVALSKLAAADYSRILAPLQPHAADLTILDGIDMASAKADTGNAHNLGQCHSLTGVKMDQATMLATGPSIDQQIAAGQPTMYRSLEVGVKGPWSPVFAGAGQALPLETSAHAFYKRVFQAFTGGDAMMLERLKAQKKSVLDFAAAEIGAVEGKLGSADKLKLDQHLAEVRDLEKRMDISAKCAPFMMSSEEQTDPYFYQYGENGTDPNVGYQHNIDFMSRVAVTALGCDITRVVTFGMGTPEAGWFGGDAGVDVHQAWAHHSDTDPKAIEMMTAMGAKNAGVFASLVQQLKDNNLLDTTLVVWCGELANGVHDFDPYPVVMAGSAGGYFKTGRYLRFPYRTPHNNLLVSLANAMGLDLQTFGDPKFCTGPLSNLRA